MQKDYVSFERKLMRINAWDKVDKKKVRERERGTERKKYHENRYLVSDARFKYSSRLSADLFSFKLLLV